LYICGRIKPPHKCQQILQHLVRRKKQYLRQEKTHVNARKFAAPFVAEYCPRKWFFLLKKLHFAADLDQCKLQLVMFCGGFKPMQMTAREKFKIQFFSYLINLLSFFIHLSHLNFFFSIQSSYSLLEISY
jgi:hypothetical protein